MKYEHLIIWSKENFHFLPWRQQRSVYRTWISEIMLQQTTVSTVQKRFELFCQTFPALENLANSSEAEILIAWKGLGYYRRAKNLRLAAKEMQEKFAKIPNKYDELLEIKGIGEYTASAILSIGYGQKFLTLDTNLQRVLSRLYGLFEEKGRKLQIKIHELHENSKILEGIEDYRALNEALMDLGRTLCQSKKTTCLACPLQEDCHAYKENLQDKLPTIKTKKQQRYQLVLARYLIKKEDKILVYKKSTKEWLSGQLELPTFIIESEDKKLTQYEWNTQLWGQEITQIHSSITKYKINNRLFSHNNKEEIENISKKKYFWLPLDELELLSSTCLKLVNKNIDIL